MPLNPLPMPLETPLVNPDRTIEFNAWVQYFAQREQQLSEAARRVVDVALTSQATAIGATALDIGTSAALYRVSVIARITQVATTNSSLTPTFRWTTGGVAVSRTYTALTGNTTSTYLVDTFPVRVDSATSLTYETAYSTSGAQAMQYSLEMAVERIA